MSRRATAVMLVVCLSMGPIAGYVLYPRIGLWCFVAPAIVGLPLGMALAIWDQRTGAEPLWRWPR